MCEDFEEGVPGDRVECFPKVQFDYNGGGLSFMTAVQQVCRINEVFGDTATGEETSLILVDKKRHKRFKSVS